jgi:glucose/arabinose dehydrogenase
MKKYLFILFILSSGFVYSQSPQLTPVTDLGSHTVAVTIPAKYAGTFPTGRTLRVPTNYTVSLYYAGGLTKPRFMAFSPAGILHVSDMNAGKIFALPDANNDGVADTIIEAATGFSGNHDVKFYKGAMYVTETTRILKCTDLNADGVYETKMVFISNLGNNQGGGHVTRTIVFDSINQKVYVAVGSSCNVCRETARAIIEQYNEDGTGRRVFASGVRNAVGMAMHPHTNRLWANNNGSDQQGNEIPPEWIDIVRDNGFYGHPFAYGGGVWFDFDAHSDYQALKPITAVDSGKVETLVQPAALIRAHTAPMALEFLTSQFGNAMQYGFITALRGSWNTTDPNDFRGYKVIYGHLSSAQDTTVDYVADFCSGFITDTINRVFWGRPVGVATDDEGKVYISSDEANKFILVLTPDETTGVIENNLMQTSVHVYPNPAEDLFTIAVSLTQSENVKASLSDMYGREVMSLMDVNLDAGYHNQQLDIRNLARGYYFVNITAGQYSVMKKLIVVD